MTHLLRCLDYIGVRLAGSVAALLLATGCSIHSGGDVRVYNLEKSRTRYGVSFRVPEALASWRSPKYGDLRDRGSLWSSFDVSIGYSRRDRFLPTGAWIRFFLCGESKTVQSCLDAAIAAVKFPPGSTWTEDKIAQFRTDKVVRWGRDCVAFEMERRWSNVGNTGQINREFGLCFVHPEDDNVIVVIQFLDGYSLPRGEQPDARVDALAEKLYQSVEFVPITEQEREQMKSGKWVLPEVW